MAKTPGRRRAEERKLVQVQRPAAERSLRPRGRIQRLIGVLLHERLEIGGRYAPFLSQFEAAHVAVAQPAGDRSLVYLEAAGNLGRRQELVISHRFCSHRIRHGFRITLLMDTGCTEKPKTQLIGFKCRQIRDFIGTSGFPAPPGSVIRVPNEALSVYIRPDLIQIS